MTEYWRQQADRHNTSIEDIKATLPLEWVISVPAGVSLYRSGEGRSKGQCPFHADTDPSFDVYVYGDRWGCYPCGKGGDIFDFIGEYWELVSFGARFEKALDLLDEFKNEAGDWASAIGPAVEAKPVTVAELGQEIQTAIGIVERETTKPITQLLERKKIGQIDIDWLKRTWRLGVTGQGEVLAPYFDEENKPVSYKTRFPQRGGWFARKGAKLTSLYGEWQLVGSLAEADIWLCEGETDTWLASWLMRGRGVALGLPAGAGSTIRPEWVEICRGKRVTIVFDNDKAGRTAAERWHTQISPVAREVSITWPQSDLCDSRDPQAVLEGGEVVPITTGFTAVRTDGKAYQAVTQNGPGEVLSNFVFVPTKKIDYRNTLGQSALDGFEGHFADQAGKRLRIKSTDFEDARSLRKWAVENGRGWTGSSAKHTQSLLVDLQAEAPFLKREIAVPVAGLWGVEEGNSVFVLPGASGGSLGSAIGMERWTYNEGHARYDIGARYRLEDRPGADLVGLIRGLLQMNERSVVTPLVAWMTAASLRSQVREFPALGVMGGSGTGKTTLTLAFMRAFWGWQKAEQNLTNTTPYAIKQASAASNGLPMWWDEYRKGAREDTFEAMGQVIRDSWTGGVSTRGGMGDDLSRIEVTAAVAPLIISGEAGLEERSHQDRVVVLQLSKAGQNAVAYRSVSEALQSGVGGALGRRIIEWQLRELDDGASVVLSVPEKTDRQEQGVAVLEWGWWMFRAFLKDEFGIGLDWELDVSGVNAQREGLDEFPEITALIEALQTGAKENPFDDMPVAWIEDKDADVVPVRQRAFYRWASRAGYVLPGGEKATLDLLKNRFGYLNDRARYVSHSDALQVRAWRLTGILNHAREMGVEIKTERRGFLGGGEG